MNYRSAWLQPEERKALDLALAGGDSPIRDMVVWLVDRLESCYVTTQIHPDLEARNGATKLAQAYRHALFTATRLCS